MGLLLAAEKTALCNSFSWYVFLDFPMAHEVEEALLKGVPVSLSLLVFIQDLLGRGKFREVPVLDAADFTKEVAQVLLFGKPCELGHIVKPDVHNALGTGLLDLGEEVLSSLLGKSNSINVHGVSSITTPGARFSST